MFLLTTVCYCLIFCFSQESPSGIYLLYTPPRKITCENELRLLVGKSKVCVSKKPIIQIEEVQHVTEIEYDPILKFHYIDVRFSLKGIETINKTAASFTDPQFVFVIHNDAICIFSVDQEITVRSLRIGEDIESKDLAVIQAALRNADL